MLNIQDLFIEKHGLHYAQLCKILLKTFLAYYNLQIPFQPSHNYVVIYICTVPLIHIVNV